MPEDRKRQQGPSIFDQFRVLTSPLLLEDRGRNAWAAGVKFLNLLEAEVDDPEEVRRILLAWMKAVKHKDLKRFLRTLRRHQRDQDTVADQNEQN